MTIAIKASCSVTGNFCAISVNTGSLSRIDLPRSPRQHAADPVQILRVDRLIEPVLLADLFQDRRIALLPGHGERRVAGQELCRPKTIH